MRFRMSLTNMIALPIALAFSEAMPGEDGGTEFAIIIGPLYLSFSWGGDADATW